VSPRQPNVPLSDYDVYIWHRGRPKATRTGLKLGADKLPATWPHDGKTYHWAATDDIEHLVIFSEIDPRTTVRMA